ncbi:hypothetical protein JTB14_020217 [Gonioctena quinquepunctata]|nr:hypothetical protein JTB14_020217 [Gonioctena quinquepunctata]
MLNGMENISKDKCSGSKDESNYIEIKTNILKFNVSDDPSLVPKNSSNLGENVYVEAEEVTRGPVDDLSQSTDDDDTHKDRNLEEVIEKSTKSGRILKKPNWMSDFVFDGNSKTSKSCNKIERTGQEDRRENYPINLKEALNGNNRFHWQDAIVQEFENLIKNRTWNFIEQPENIKAIKTKWVFKTKYNENGGIEKFKARVVALGNTQRPGIDFDQTYAPVVQKKTMRMLFAIAAEMDWSIHQMDITAAYLSADLKDTVYMEIPEGYDKSYERSDDNKT